MTRLRHILHRTTDEKMQEMIQENYLAFDISCEMYRTLINTKWVCKALYILNI